MCPQIWKNLWSSKCSYNCAFFSGLQTTGSSAEAQRAESSRNWCSEEEEEEERSRLQCWNSLRKETCSSKRHKLILFIEMQTPQHQAAFRIVVILSLKFYILFTLRVSMTPAWSSTYLWSHTSNDSDSSTWMENCAGQPHDALQFTFKSTINMEPRCA